MNIFGENSNGIFENGAQTVNIYQVQNTIEGQSTDLTTIENQINQIEFELTENRISKLVVKSITIEQKDKIMIPTWVPSIFKVYNENGVDSSGTIGFNSSTKILSMSLPTPITISRIEVSNLESKVALIDTTPHALDNLDIKLYSDEYTTQIDTDYVKTDRTRNNGENKITIYYQTSLKDLTIQNYNELYRLQPIFGEMKFNIDTQPLFLTISDANVYDKFDEFNEDKTYNYFSDLCRDIVYFDKRRMAVIRNSIVEIKFFLNYKIIHANTGTLPNNTTISVGIFKNQLLINDSITLEQPNINVHSTLSNSYFDNCNAGDVYEIRFTSSEDDTTIVFFDVGYIIKSVDSKGGF